MPHTPTVTRSTDQTDQTDRTGRTDRTDRRVRGPDVIRPRFAAAASADRRRRDRSVRARAAGTVRVSLVIPAHDEEDRLPATLSRYAAALADRYGDAVEILVVANGCTDGTAAAGRRLANEIPGLRVIDIPEPILKGGAVLVGLREALGSAIVFADADGATDEKSLLALLDGLDDADVVIGTRYGAGSVIVRGQPLGRRILSRIFNTTVRVLFGLPFRDTQCGAKAFRASAAKRLAGVVEERDWTFDLDLILAARRLRLAVAERPVVWTDIEGSHLRTQRVAPAVLRALWRLWWRERAADARAATRLRSARVASQRILALNWRCPRHPEAGGAELNLFEQARRWASQGHEVTVITARSAGSIDLPPFEVIDGVAVRRMGGRFSVYLRAAWYLLTRGWRYDRILDVANGIPFFAPLFTGRPVALLVHHVHDRQWFTEFPRPVAAIGWLLERWVVPRVYRHRPAIAVSPTTRDALVATGFEPEDVHIVYNGVTAEAVESAGRRQPTILYVGRIKRYKRLDRLVRAFGELRRRFPQARLVVAGGGDAAPELEALASELGLDDSVRFPGVVDEPTKARLLATATVFATPSMQEGWGLSVIEANFHGTPAVAYDVPGLRAAIRPGETGILVRDDRGFRDAIVRLLEDRVLWSRLSANAREWATRFDWDKTAARTLSIMQSASADASPPRDVSPTANVS